MFADNTESCSVFPGSPRRARVACLRAMIKLDASVTSNGAPFPHREGLRPPPATAIAALLATSRDCSLPPSPDRQAGRPGEAMEKSGAGPVRKLLRHTSAAGLGRVASLRLARGSRRASARETSWN